MYNGSFRWLDDLPKIMIVFGILAGIGLWKIGEIAVEFLIYLVTHLQWVN